MGIIDQKITDKYSLYNGDCMEVIPEIKNESIDFSIFSPPFPELYQYSNDPRDMSNCLNYDETMESLSYVFKELYRLIKPGRIMAVHCMDLKKTMFSKRDFPGDIISINNKIGFDFYCRTTIWKDPWLVARRTMVTTLKHKSLVEDSADTAIAGADYIVVFRKPGENKEPIEHRKGLTSYAGDQTLIPSDLKTGYRNYTGSPATNKLSHWIFRQYMSPVWMDIRTGELVGYDDSECKENPEEKHVCPLQLDIIERCLQLWSNKNDIILTPFMGVGSEIFSALKNDRRAIGIELKPTYYRQALRNAEKALEKKTEKQLEIF
jgi:DNA modification methylase